MHPLIESLIKEGPVLTDGSWGTQMQRRGLSRGECPDSWNLTKPESVEAVARLYVEAGSRVILTNTFGASRIALLRYKLGDKTEAVNKAGVEISKRAAAANAYVFASIGPSGKLLVTKETTEAELAEVYEEQARAQFLGGADAIVVETMIDVVEARIAAAAAKKTGLPVIACMVYDSGPDKDTTMMGNTPEQVVEELTAVGVDGIGANCGQGIEAFIPICRRLRAATDLPIWIKPNAGLPEAIEDELVFNTTPEEFVASVPELVQSGANFIGGCCGTDERFVSEIRRVLERTI